MISTVELLRRIFVMAAIFFVGGVGGMALYGVMGYTDAGGYWAACFIVATVFLGVFGGLFRD